MKELGCDHCEYGWVKVADSYGAKVYPGPSEEDLARMTPENRARVEVNTAAAQAAISDSVYPCKHCNTRAFFRWQGGHWRADHNRSECEECNPKAAANKGRSSVMDPPPHTDSDWKDRADLR